MRKRRPIGKNAFSPCLTANYSTSHALSVFNRRPTARKFALSHRTARVVVAGIRAHSMTEGKEGKKEGRRRKGVRKEGKTVWASSSSPLLSPYPDDGETAESPSLAAQISRIFYNLFDVGKSAAALD